jgi:hypothetical protein
MATNRKGHHSLAHAKRRWRFSNALASMSPDPIHAHRLPLHCLSSLLHHDTTHNMMKTYTVISAYTFPNVLSNQSMIILLSCSAMTSFAPMAVSASLYLSDK